MQRKGLSLMSVRLQGKQLEEGASKEEGRQRSATFRGESGGGGWGWVATKERERERGVVECVYKFMQSRAALRYLLLLGARGDRALLSPERQTQDKRKQQQQAGSAAHAACSCIKRLLLYYQTHETKQPQQKCLFCTLCRSLPAIGTPASSQTSNLQTQAHIAHLNTLAPHQSYTQS
jgi:hypothetical protein